MTIDEAIEKHRKIAETKKTLYDACILKEYNRHLLREYKEHEQIAEWLEELKMYKEVGTVEGYKSAIECYNEEYTMRKSNKQYNKAIDDFANKIINYVDCGHLCEPLQVRWSDYSVVEMVKRMAEQLKAGGENENYNKEEN